MKKLFMTLKFIYLKVRQYEKKYMQFLFVRILMSVFKVWISIAMIGILINMLENGSSGEQIVFVVIACAFTCVINVIEHYVGMKVKIASNNVNNELNIHVYENMISINYAEQEKEETRIQYEFARIAINEIGVSKITDHIIGIAESIVNIAIAVITLSIINIYIIFAVVLVVVINIISEIYKIKCEYNVNQEMANVELNLYYARDYLVSPKFAKEIRTLNMVDYVLNKLKKAINRFTKLKVLIEMKYLKKFWMVYLLDGILLIIIYLFCIYEYMYVGMELSYLSVYLSAMTTLVYSLLSIVKSSAEISGNGEYIMALERFLHKEKTANMNTAVNDKFLKVSDYTIEFVNVSFKYPGAEDYTLKNISFKVGSSDKISVVGKNGAGKTTLVKLLLRLYIPTSGKILINGRDYIEMSEDEIRKLYSVVLQDFGIYSFSINANVSMGEVADPTKLDECIKKVNLFKKVDTLMDKGETYITQRLDKNGIELSGGEAQKLAMARAMYKDSPIYIFDEPTSALSPQSEYEIYRNFKDITKGKMTFFISHRLASCKLCDKIMVLNNGILENIGNHEELMKFDNLYSQMFRVQAESFNI